MQGSGRINLVGMASDSDVRPQSLILQRRVSGSSKREDVQINSGYGSSWAVCKMKVRAGGLYIARIGWHHQHRDGLSMKA